MFRLRANLIMVVLSFCWSIIIAIAEPVYVVNRLQVNIRTDATVQSERIAVLDKGQEIELLWRKDEWIQIRLPDGRNGWVHSDLVQEKVVVLGRQVHLRVSGSPQAEVLTTLEQEQELGRIRQVGDWSEVVLADGRKGWMISRFLGTKNVSVSSAESPTNPLPPTVSEPPRVEAAAIQPKVVSLKPEPEPEPEPPIVLRRNEYAAGLQFETNGRYEEALNSFEAVLRQEPKNLKALYHAAQAHIRLNQLDSALNKLYQALEFSDGRPDSRYYLALGEVYRLKIQPDSSLKYQALFKGEEYSDIVPSLQINKKVVASKEENSWLYILFVVFIVVVIGGFIIAVLWRRRGIRNEVGNGEKRKKEKGGAKPPKEKFSQLMKVADEAPLEQVGRGEEEELDRQINEKWNALQAGTASFVKPDAWKETTPQQEEKHLEDLLGYVEDLRSGLEQQDQRSAVYADIVRLQNMKIEALNDEIRLLRQRQGENKKSR